MRDGIGDPEDVSGAINYGYVEPRLIADAGAFETMASDYQSTLNTFERETGLRIWREYLQGDGDCYDELSPDNCYWFINEGDVYVPKKRSKPVEDFIAKYGDDSVGFEQRFSTYG